LNTLAQIANKGAGFRSHADAWADTTTAHGRLMLSVLGGLAEFDRDLIRSRTTEGRERARADAVKMGRPSKLTAHQKKEVIKGHDHGEETLAEIRQRPTKYAERHLRTFACSSIIAVARTAVLQLLTILSARLFLL
jgi:DNA invertase Pin-like site-specific DNA recombinase